MHTPSEPYGTTPSLCRVLVPLNDGSQPGNRFRFRQNHYGRHARAQGKTGTQDQPLTETIVHREVVIAESESRIPRTTRRKDTPGHLHLPAYRPTPSLSSVTGGQP